MLLTLLKALNTSDLEKVVKILSNSMAELDIDVMFYEAQEAGEIEIDKKKNKIKALKEPGTLYYNEKLLSQIKKIIRFYDQQGANITRNRLEMTAASPMSLSGYPMVDVYCTMYYLDESGEVNKYELTVPKLGKRPFNRFQFYTFVDHQEFGAKAVNDFIAQFDKK